MKQICPKCKGQGTVSKPPYVPGDVYEWSSSASSFECNLCNGTMVIEYETPADQGQEELERQGKIIVSKFGYEQQGKENSSLKEMVKELEDGLREIEKHGYESINKIVKQLLTK